MLSSYEIVSRTEQAIDTFHRSDNHSEFVPVASGPGGLTIFDLRSVYLHLQQTGFTNGSHGKYRQSNTPVEEPSTG